MAFKIGDKIIIASDMSNPDSIREYTVSKVMKDTIQCGSSEMTFYTTFCWPIAAKNELIRVITERQKLKAIYDDSMKLVYELRNKISRGEL